MASGAAERPPIRTFLTTVQAVEDLHPGLRQITFRGGDLVTLQPVGPDTFLYVLLPPPGRSRLTIDQSFTWEAHQGMPEDERPVGAYYTLRRWRAELAELDMHFVLHGDTGPASAWAARARPGDPVALWGPRTTWHPPADTDSYLLAADDTGLPAVAAILESLPADATVRVFAEVDDAMHRAPMPGLGANVEVTWLHRIGRPPGTTSLLADAIAASTPPVGIPYAWGGGASHAMTAIRRHLRDAVGLARDQVAMVAYWRHQDHLPDDED